MQVPVQHPYSILLVKKPNSAEYCFAQDLRAINEVIQDLHPVVSNPYTLLTAILGEYSWLPVLDLKDAFFCIPIAEESQQLKVKHSNIGKRVCQSFNIIEVATQFFEEKKKRTVLVVQL